MGASWSIGNVHRDASLVPSLAPYVNKNALGGLLLGTFLLSLCYPLFHHLYQRYSEIYKRELRPHQRVVVIQHSIQALFLSLALFPTTYLLASFNFQAQTLDELGPKATMSAVFLGLVVVMYCLELASRIEIRPLLLLHHGATTIMGMYCVAYFTEANITTASLLVYFITYEAIIFVGLVLYRLWPAHDLTHRVLYIGMVVFGATRPLQVLTVLISLLVNRHHLIAHQAVLDGGVTVAFTLLQLYTLRIHYGMYLRSRALAYSSSSSPRFHYNSVVENTAIVVVETTMMTTTTIV
jgi:hypothetical protein